MTYPCEYSSLTIPNDPAYQTIAAKYIVEVARKMGFQEPDVETIEQGVSRAIGELIDYSFEPGEKATIDVSCERIPVGLRITIRDKGLPFDSSGIIPSNAPEPQDQESGAALNPLQLRGFMDEVAFHNLGRDGKETVLVKHLRNRSITDYYEACELEPFAPPAPRRPEPQGDQECTVRTMAEEEAAEVSKCMYEAYGYTYVMEHVYYPERLAELNRSGRMISAVAVTQQDEIIGHCALSFHREGTRIAEMGQGAVKPEYRGRGCFNKLVGYLVEKGKAAGLMGIFGEAVSNHTYTQQVAHRLGFKDCGVILGLISQDVSYKGITDVLSNRVSAIVHFMYLDKTAVPELFPPRHHLEIIRKTYQNLGISLTVRVPDRNDQAPLTDDSVIKSTFIRSLGFARIEINRYGTTVVKEVKALLKKLCLEKTEVINLYLNLADPLTGILTEDFEAMGFFYAAIVPGAMPTGDALVLQYLNNVPIDYSDIKTESETGKELLSYVMAHDPNIV